MHQVIFKSGDDLRQDQLIMQMISLMDSLLKRVNLDLRCAVTVLRVSGRTCADFWAFSQAWKYPRRNHDHSSPPLALAALGRLSSREPPSALVLYGTPRAKSDNSAV